MKDLMIDLETMGKRAGCALLSIGAVFFDPKTGYLGHKFYAVVSLSDCQAWGLDVDPDTESWWAKQEPEAREILTLTHGPSALSLPHALKAFSEWVNLAKPEGVDVNVWGNGADFDLPILAAAYDTVGEPLPWKPYSGRCYRTLKNLARHIKAERSGTHHNAIDDAITQANHAVAILKWLGQVKADASYFETTAKVVLEGEPAMADMLMNDWPEPTNMEEMRAFMAEAKKRIAARDNAEVAPCQLT